MPWRFDSRGVPNILTNNIFFQTASSYVAGDGLYTVRYNHYGSDSAHAAALAGDQFQSNCYFNPHRAVEFSYFGGPPTSTGGVYTLGQMKSLGLEQGSIESDPQFVDPAGLNFRLRAGSPCSAMGVYADGQFSPPLTPTAARGW